MIPFLDLKGLNAQYRAELIEACTKVIDSGWYIQGNECKEFEAEFANYCGTKYAIGVANGLDALILILRAYKELGFMKDGDEVIVPSNTYIASILAISQNNLVPVLVEPDINTYLIDPSKIEEKAYKDAEKDFLLPFGMNFASIDQYSSGLNFLISSSLSTIILTATD